MMPFAVVNVDAELKERSTGREEPLGTKQKFWFWRNPGYWLFKFCRAGTGEDWAERVAAELAQRLRLPHADVELATFGNHRGVVVRDFTQSGDTPLVHGNELHFERDPRYPRGEFFGVQAHTVAGIVEVFSEISFAPNESLPDDVDDALGLFTGYLMLDALIANTDRHHENWGVLVLGRTRHGGRLSELAPTYDHASSLGRELADGPRARKYVRCDGSYDVAKYLGKARGAIYGADSQSVPLSPLDAFRRFAEHRPGAARGWLRELDRVGLDAILEPVDAVPDAIMSASQKRYARELLTYTRLQLLENVRG